MLIPFTDIKGRQHWVNPVHVKVVTTNKKGQTEVCLAFNGTGFGIANAAIVIDRPADHIAQELNAAMPINFPLPPGDDQGPDSGAAAAHVAIMG